MSPAIGVQLYTLREACQEDILGTLERVREIGYRGVEWFGGRFGASQELLVATLERTGLAILSAHVPLETLEGDLDPVVAMFGALGCRDLVCPWLSEERRRGAAAYEAVGRTLDRAASRLAEHGFRLAYHNHDFELTEVEPPNGIERILAQSTHDLLGLEPDVYWLAYAGADPAAVLRALRPRVRFVHLKDGSLGAAPAFAPLGQGDVDLDVVIAAALEVEAEALIVEQDATNGSPFDAIAQSLAYLNSSPRLRAANEATGESS